VNEKVERECPVCGLIYDADPVRLKFGRRTTCSRRCSYELRAREHRQSEERECAVCGNVFYRSPAQIAKVKHGALTCSRECAYQTRKRVVTSPYVLTAVYDRRAAGKKAWETRRANPKPYPDAARLKAAANLAQNVEKLGRVSKFELEAADVFRRLGFLVNQSVAVRNPDGTFLTVFDIVIPNRRMVVECHGTYWHGGRWSWDTPNATQVKNLRYEQRKLAVARSVGYDLRLLWEHEFRQDPTGACLAVVR